MKVSELTGEALDLAVARALGASIEHENLTDGWRAVVPGYHRAMGVGPHAIPNCVTFERYGESMVVAMRFSPSTDWSQGGPIIERERIALSPSTSGVHGWAAKLPGREHRIGQTPLIACMRAYVASKFGEEVPDPS